VTHVLIAASAVDQHADVAVDRFHDAEANFGPAVVENPIDVFDQRGGQLLKRGQALPSQLIHPLPQVVHHSLFVTVVPELFEAFLEHISLKYAPVQLKESVQNSTLGWRQVLPATQQQPPLPFNEVAHLRSFAEEF